MNDLIKYLLNPMEVGVYNARFKVDFSNVSIYLTKILEKFKLQKKGKRGYNRDFFKNSITALEKALKSLKPNILIESGLEKHDTFTDVLNALSLYCLFTRDIPDDVRHFFNVPTGLFGEIKGRGTSSLFTSRIISKLEDVLLIEKEQLSRYEWLFDVVATKKESIHDFKNTMNSIPPISEYNECKKERQHFSTRHSFRTYPLMVKLWLASDESGSIQSDLKSFLSSSVKYYFSEEWRTSIILSAITIESELADLYEEYYRETAPDSPLGILFERVKLKCQFPTEIVKAVEMANNARIAAVHRSRFPVSNKEAINALFGATKFTLWNEFNEY